MALSENEKAATFIGWKRWTCDQDVEPMRQCWKCKDVHRRAPDMSKPENYMRALELLPKRHLAPSLHWQAGYGWIFDCGRYGEDEDDYETVLGCRVNYGEVHLAVLYGLDALYDALKENSDAK